MSEDKRSRLVAAGRWLQDARKRHGYDKAAEFARALQVDPSQVSQWERGINRVSDEKAEEIADLFGMDDIELRRNLALWVPREHRQQEDVQDEALEVDDEELLKAVGTPRFDELFRRRIAQLPRPEREAAERLVEEIDATNRRNQTMLQKILLFARPRDDSKKGGETGEASVSQLPSIRN